MQRKKLVILADYGLDDAAATVYLLAHKARFLGIDIIAVAGNSPAERSLSNARKLLSNYEGDLSGVRLIDSTALPQPFANLPSIHGEDGMGDLLCERALTVPLLSYADWLGEPHGAFTLVSLGPATVTIDILDRVGARELLVMGGHIHAAPNFNGYEFNHYLDIPAFNRMLAYPHVCATLDTCRNPAFNYADWTRPDDSLLSRLIERAVALAVARHPDNCYIYDYIAVHYLTAPDAFTTVPATDLEGNRVSELKYTGGSRGDRI